MTSTTACVLPVCGLSELSRSLRFAGALWRWRHAKPTTKQKSCDDAPPRSSCCVGAGRSGIAARRPKRSSTELDDLIDADNAQAVASDIRQLGASLSGTIQRIQQRHDLQNQLTGIER